MAGEVSGAVGGAGGAAGAGTPAGGGAGAAAAAAPGAAPGAGSQASGAVSNTAPPAAGTPSDWTSSLNDDFKGMVQNKGWKAPTDVLDSYRNLEKLVGAPQDQIIRMPKDDDPAAWDSVYSRLGRPATPDAYKLETPKEGGDPAFTKWAAEQFHKAGLNEKQAKAVTDAWNAKQAEARAGQTEAYNAKITNDTASLKKEWGAAYEQNLGLAKRAAREFGVSGEVVDAVEKTAGFAATMKLFQAIGSKLGDATFVQGNGNYGQGMGPMTPAQAQDRIKAVKADTAWSKRYLEGAAKERGELEMLHKYAYPEA